MNRTLPSLFVVLAVLSACAARPGSSSDTLTDSPTPAPSGGATDDIAHPGGSEPILIVDSVGGFVPIQFMATGVPSFVLLGDGRVIMHGPQTLEFPGPALPALIERTLTEQGIQQILKGVEDTNLFTSDLELRNAPVADAADTRFILDAGGRQVTVSVYGLGTLPPDMEPPPGMSSAEVEAHRILGQLNDGLMTLDSWLPAEAWETEGWQPFEAEAFRLYVHDVTGQPVEGGDLPAQVRQWPTADDPATFGEPQPLFGDGTRCGVASGDLAATWALELAAANQLTLWTDDGTRRFSVAARPVLPYEDPACPELGGGA
jgi:hypothetical protein